MFNIKRSINSVLSKGMDIKDLVEIVILEYDHWPQLSSKMSLIQANDHFVLIKI